MNKTKMPDLKSPPKGLFEATSTGSFNVDGGIAMLPLDSLVPFSEHPFKLYTGEKLQSLVESIKANGVMVPIIVSGIDDGNRYEILSGHNRVNAARLAGLESIQAIVKNNLTDDEAILVVTTTNLIQRQFGEMSHSERAAVLSVHHNAIKQQGRRADLVNEIENLLKASDSTENRTSSPLGHKLKSRDKVGQEYALSKNTVARYLRVNTLIEPLKVCLDGNEFGVRVAVALSYLSEDVQHHVADIITSTHHKLDMAKADELRAKHPRGRDEVERIIAEQKPRQSKAFSLKPKLVAKYFANNTPKEIESTIIAALKLYFDTQEKGEPP